MPRTPAPKLTVEVISPDLKGLIVPITWLKTLPGNPRRGKVEALAKSYKQFGQRAPIIVNVDGEVDGHPTGFTESGNHQLEAALGLGWNYIAVSWENDDEVTAKAFALAANQTHEIGHTDEASLADMVAEVAVMNGGVDLLDSAGFTGDEMTALIESTLARTETDSMPGDDEGAYDDVLPEPGIGLGTPVISTSIVFDTEEQQSSWYEFIRFLRRSYPDMETTGERIAEYLTTVDMEEE